MHRLLIFLTIAILANPPKAASQLSLKGRADSIPARPAIRPLPQNFYTSRLGFICKKELQMQKTLRLPLFFRLGSKDYVDYMERKKQLPIK